MVKRYLALFPVLVLCASCSLFSHLRKRTFSIKEGADVRTLGVLVPKRYTKRETGTDSSGNRSDYYRYGNGAILYIIHTTDTATLFQPIDTANNVPLPYSDGGVMYKGLDSAGRFWREVRTDSFRFGYRSVPHDQEILFDSAVNYAGKQRVKN